MRSSWTKRPNKIKGRAWARVSVSPPFNDGGHTARSELHFVLEELRSRSLHSPLSRLLQSRSSICMIGVQAQLKCFECKTNRSKNCPYNSTHILSFFFFHLLIEMDNYSTVFCFFVVVVLSPTFQSSFRLPSTNNVFVIAFRIPWLLEWFNLWALQKR